jgi:GMP synthase (glutamine-hydrolysing)
MRAERTIALELVMPNTVALRHVAFEDLGLLGPILASRGHAVRYIDVPVEPLDSLDPLAPDLLVVLGGPIGVYQTEEYPFLVQEIELIARRLAAGRPTLGICLGSQLIARALGKRVYASGAKEIGWGTIELTSAGRESCMRHLAETPVLHWHGDTFDLPEGATLLASTALCTNQAFLWGEHVLGIQFHIEAAGVALESWFVGHTSELAASGIDIASLRADTARWTSGLVASAARCFEEWLDSAGL